MSAMAGWIALQRNNAHAAGVTPNAYRCPGQSHSHTGPDCRLPRDTSACTLPAIQSTCSGWTPCPVRAAAPASCNGRRHAGPTLLCRTSARRDVQKKGLQTASHPLYLGPLQGRPDRLCQARRVIAPGQGPAVPASAVKPGPDRGSPEPCPGASGRPVRRARPRRPRCAPDPARPAPGKGQSRPSAA